eukprot:11186270-Lingulodinium_polyedra.AAC.1
MADATEPIKHDRNTSIKCTSHTNVANITIINEQSARSGTTIQTQISKLWAPTLGLRQGV